MESVLKKKYFHKQLRLRSRINYLVKIRLSFRTRRFPSQGEPRPEALFRFKKAVEKKTYYLEMLEQEILQREKEALSGFR